MVMALKKFGYYFEAAKIIPEQLSPVVTLRWHRQALFMAAFTPDTTVSLKMRFPEGIPLFTETDVFIKDNIAEYRLERAVNWECRIFIEQEKGLIQCREVCSENPSISRRLEVSGLHNATVRFYPEPDTDAKVEFLLNPDFFHSVGTILPVEVITYNHRLMLESKDISGTLQINW